MLERFRCRSALATCVQDVFFLRQQIDNDHQQTFDKNLSTANTSFNKKFRFGFESSTSTSTSTSTSATTTCQNCQNCQNCQIDRRQNSWHHPDKPLQSSQNLVAGQACRLIHVTYIGLCTSSILETTRFFADSVCLTRARFWFRLQLPLRPDLQDLLAQL